MNNFFKTSEIFKSKPTHCLIMALLFLVISIINLSGWIPVSPNRPFQKDFAWIFSLLSLFLSLLFAYWSILGFHRRSKNK